MTDRVLPESALRSPRIEALRNQYRNKPEVQALITFVAGAAGTIPLVGSLVGGTVAAVDVFLQRRWQEMRERDLCLFLEEVAQGTQYLTREQMDQDSFLRALFAAYSAAARAR